MVFQRDDLPFERERRRLCRQRLPTATVDPARPFLAPDRHSATCVVSDDDDCATSSGRFPTPFCQSLRRRVRVARAGARDSTERCFRWRR